MKMGAVFIFAPLKLSESPVDSKAFCTGSVDGKTVFMIGKNEIFTRFQINFRRELALAHNLVKV